MGSNAKEETIHPSVANIVEHHLVDLILDGPDSYWRSNIFRLKGISDDSVAVRRVRLRDAPGANEGDIDILLCSPNEPWLATAIEVKRIKVGPRAFLTGEPNKLRELETAVFQAEKLVSIGFSQVYLYVLVAVDSREHNLGKETYEGLTPKLRERIESAISKCVSNEGIGLLHCEFEQPMNSAPLMDGGSRVHLKKPAQTVLQTAELTRWVAEKIARESRATTCGR
jgi:hypothetical protein